MVTSASRHPAGGLRRGSRWRRPVVAFTAGMTLVGYLFVLGAATPVFRVAYLLIPGMSLFRFPTRFLIVVELGLALLAAVGLTRLRGDLRRRWPDSREPIRRHPPYSVVIVAAVCRSPPRSFLHQPRQNPIVPAATGSPAGERGIVRGDAAEPRTFTPRLATSTGGFQRARGWADVGPYFEVRGPGAQPRRRALGMPSATATPASRRAGMWTSGATTTGRRVVPLLAALTSRRRPCACTRRLLP